MIQKRDSTWELIANCLVCALAGAILVCMCYFRVLGSLDDRIYDAVMGFSSGGAAEAENSGIVIVTIDEESLAEIGKRWPWDRALYAKAIDWLAAAGAKAIGIDLLFIEGSESDEALAGAMKRAGNVVIAAKMEYMNRSFGSGNVSFSGTRLVLPQPVFRNAASPGIVNLEIGSGSIIRQYKPFYKHQDEQIPSFSVEIYNKAFGKLPDVADSDNGLIDYFGPPGSFPSVPFYQVLNGIAREDMFKNRIVLVGATFSDSHDFFATPLSASAHPSPGIEVQANILGTLVKKSNIEYMSFLPQLVILLTLVALSGYLAMFRSAYFLWLAFAVCATLIVSLSVWLVCKHEIVLEVSYPLCAMPLTFFMVSLRMRKTLVLDTKIGPYILHEELGRGGMAVVYRATHPKTGEEVALKQMLPQFAADEQSLTRFLMETELLRELDHPNIIRIIDAGDVNKCPYYAMELITGPSLDNVMKKKGRFSNTEVRQIGGAIARALARAHEAGVIHRDIKPSNIMMTDTGIPKLTDFGIAKRLDSAQLTMTGVIIGTPAFLAPEMCNGESATMSSDIYSFGATMFAMLCGRPPFKGDNIHSIINMVVNKPAPNIRKLCTTVEDELAFLVMRCLEKESEKRPESMLEVARILDPFYTDIAMKSTSGTRHPIPFLDSDKTVVEAPLNLDDIPVSAKHERDGKDDSDRTETMERE